MSSSSSSSSAAASAAHQASELKALMAVAMKPGQKLPTPSPGHGDRVFYESLFAEKGLKSEMAVIWCVEHGIFQGDAIDKMNKEYLRIKNKAK